ncbi:MAG: ParB N-terminal domain-containing protein, partial [Spirochaetes bacterium]|nr:ParB N-terminal domain-containing protein [Spirochaetota bacterium]
EGGQQSFKRPGTVMITHSGSDKAGIPLKNIDIENRYYKLSRNIIDEKLERSIAAYGVIEPPLLLKKNETYIIITGHNRIGIASRLGIWSVDSVIIEELDYETFVKYALLRHYRNEIGPAGRTRLIKIIMKEFTTEYEKLSKLANDFDLPSEFIMDPALPEKILNLPDTLKDYIDFKDINIKTIKNILRLPEKTIFKLSEWVSHITLRANIFKNIVEYLVDKIIKNLNGSGVKIDFPEYFEGEEIGLRLSVNKRENPALAGERIKIINTDDIKKLLELL